VHLQLGRAYNLEQGSDPKAYALLRQIKDVVDPKGLMNPAALGLAKGA
jgi:glycolate oxidase